MCLIAFAYRVHPHYPLVLVGNRDEFHARPAAALDFWPQAEGMLGGRDLQGGGAWLAATTAGRVAAVTNVRLPQPPAAGALSRGGLIPPFLAAGDTPEQSADDLLASAGHYAAFNLLMYAPDAGMQFVSNHPAPRRQPVAAGIHGLSNADLDSPWPKSLRLSAALEQLLPSGGDPIAGREQLFAALADETPTADALLPCTGMPMDWERKLGSAFIRGPGYGSRASSVVCVGHAGLAYFEERSFGPDGIALGTRRWSAERGLERSWFTAIQSNSDSSATAGTAPLAAPR
jgi:uncharacterized protein with NRDE domain